jgi:predicted dithiol-disulfide oxidoreductase (DUF899 family)/catechol 2,3-dioxygenase-like lactoylglutathione lyase family enzyme
MNQFQKFNEQVKTQEQKVRTEVEKLYQLHTSRPPERIQRDYEFKTILNTVKLSELFGDHDELIVIHNMGKQCAYCTLWADGFNGYYYQLARRVGFVLVNNDTPEEQHQFAVSRKWNFPIYSSRGTSFFEDMGFTETIDGKASFEPGLSVFRKTSSGAIERTTCASFGPGDLFSSIWNLYGILPKGVNHWEPTNKPVTASRGYTKIDGLNVAAVYCENPEVSAQFYKDVLGFENAKTKLSDGILLHNKDADLTLYLGKDHSPQISLCFNSQLGVLDAAKELKARGIEIVNQYGSKESGFAGVQFKDPSGNLLEIAGTP